MTIRFLSSVTAILLVATNWSAGNVATAFVQEEKTESRMQAVLQLNGTFLPNGGFKITEAPTTGPGANLDLPNAGEPTRGILESGDLIIEIEGREFRDRREFLDLMNEAYRKNSGTVQITVKDVTTGRAVVWAARPVMVQIDVPVANRLFDFLEELGKQVPEAPPVPTVPATIDP